MRILIADLNIKMDGHKFGFVNNLLKFIEAQNESNQYFFLVNNANDFDLTSVEDNIKILKTTDQQQANFNNQKHFFQKSALEWKIIDSTCLDNKIDRLILMEIDLYQIEIGKSKTPYAISGIWFRPYSRMQKEGKGFKATLNFIRTIVQKKLVMHFALRNSKLEKLFILNDEAMPNWLNKKQKRFFHLPDPYFEYPQIPNFDLKKTYNIPAENFIILQFGNMDERKNNENIIAALNQMEDKIAQKISFLVIGKFKKDYLKTVQSLKAEKAQFQMILRDEFVSDSEMESTFAQSDLIMRMNINFFGSSGIVGQAANHNKPCFVSNTGVMAEQVEKYKLGAIIDPFNVNEIQKTIEYYLTNPESRIIDGSNYRNTHNLECFAKTLLDFN